MGKNPLVIDCISDLHGEYSQLQGGDLLIVAGDLTATHTKREFGQFADWYMAQPYRHRILIAGNHDDKIQNGDYYFNHGWLGYLRDSGTEIDGLKIWGTPWTRSFVGENPNALAYTCDHENGLAAYWDCIPQDTDILVTHSPPHGILDRVRKGKFEDMAGSRSLRDRIALLPNLKLHVFGHIHESYGIFQDLAKQTYFVNASHVNENYEPVNAPIRINLGTEGKETSQPDRGL